MGIATIRNKEVIIQSNLLIEAHYRLTLQEKRLILWLIKEIKSEDIDFKKYRFDISEFAQMMGFNPKTQYREMKRVTKSLITRSIEINDVEKQETTQMSWLCFARWEFKRGVCFLEFHPELKPYLLQLKKQFTKIGFSDFLGLKSVYSVRIFELLVQYAAIGTRRMKIEELKTWCGIREDEYHFYAHLKSRLIEKAKTEINTKTEYNVDYTEIKESRKIVAIEWTIRKKNAEQEEQLEKIKQLQQELRSEHAIIESLLEYGFSRHISKMLIKKHGEDTVKNAIRAVDIQIQRKRARNPKAMLQTAILEKWHPEIFKTRQVKK